MESSEVNMEAFMRHLALGIVAAISFLAPAHARELTELRDRVRDGVQRTDKDLANYVKRDKLNAQQKERLDSAVEDLDKLREAVTSDKWQQERKRLERAVENIDFLVKNAPLQDAEKQSLGIDIYTLQVILDAWTPKPGEGSGKN